MAALTGPGFACVVALIGQGCSSVGEGPDWSGGTWTGVFDGGSGPADGAMGTNDAGPSSSLPDGQVAYDGAVDGAIDGVAGYAAVPPAAYVAKVKSLLTGLAPSADEVAQVEANPAALRDLIASWQALPSYETRLLDFFTMAFQQGDVTAALIASATDFMQGFMDPRVIQNMRESFGRTAIQLTKEGRPFTEVLTTDRLMMTPALMVAMTWLEERQSGDGGGVRDALHDKLGPSAQYTMQGDERIPLEESMDPNSPNYLRFYAPQVAAHSDDCGRPFVVDLDDRITLYTHTMGETLMMWFMGSRIQRGFCVYEGQGILEPADFTNWRMMRIRKPAQGEEPTWVYEIPTFRNATELKYPKPHVGFYTTPAFLYTWQTNPSNQARVTVNQTLIAALGRKFDASLSATPVSEAALSFEHTPLGTGCYACHRTMDPMRQFFRNTYSYYMGLQEDPTQLAMPGIFAFDGRSEVGSDIADLGRMLGESDKFAIGWVHKLCTWANGAVCDPSGSPDATPSDEEFQRLVRVFEESDFDFALLVRELFSSPLVTGQERTSTAEAQGATVPVSKKQHLCRVWDQRLGLTDVCGLRALPTTESGDPIRTIATVLPSDSYSRGQTMPTLANDPGLFFYAGVEAACRTLSERVVDSGGTDERFSSADADAAIARLVHDFMGLPAPRDAVPLEILHDHYDDAVQGGQAASAALRSTFTLACMSPTVTGVGL